MNDAVRSAVLAGLAIVACAETRTEKSTGTNWITCHDDDDCVAVPGATCSARGVCVDDRGDPVSPSPSVPEDNVPTGARHLIDVDCFSPGQHLDRAYDEGARGCRCTPKSRSLCVGGIALVCGASSRWVAVEDGPCARCWTPEDPELAFAFPDSGCPCTGDDEAAAGAAPCVQTFEDGARNATCVDGKWKVTDGKRVCICATDAQCGYGGRCVDGACLPASCEVDGVRYAEGVDGIPDPDGCNYGMCHTTGFGTSTLAECLLRCPEGTTSAAACMACGPAGGCALVRTGCLPVCNDSTGCAPPFTCDPVDHVCRMPCL